MDIIEIINKKKDGKVLTKDEIEFAIEGYISKEIADYQMSSLLMAICINGMTDEETINLTNSITKTGEQFDLSKIEDITVDKHSTGGVGDKVTLILLPIMASLDIPMIKMSGRGLGFTGGTADKLESIENFKMNYTLEEAIDMANKYKLCQMTQSENMCLADKEIYSLRSVTGTVDSIPLIASSIMSKKLACGCDKILLDVTCGNGAFMNNIEEARKLARLMVDIGNGNKKQTIAVITNMDEPLGKTIGNSLEIIETIEFLKGRCQEDILEVIKTIGAYIIYLANKGDNIEENKELIERQIYNGNAYKKFQEWIKIQGGNINQINDISLLPKTENILAIKSPKTGYISKIKASQLGYTLIDLGGGRKKKNDKIDYGVGIVLNYKVSYFVNEGDTLCYVHINDLSIKDKIEKKIIDAYEFSDKPIDKPTMILDIIK